MRILIITQVFHPDTVSVSQHLTDLAKKLVQDGHEVTVYTSRYPYEEKTQQYESFGNYQGITIRRLWQSSFGKGNNIARLFDFLTFYFFISIKLLFLKKNVYDMMLGTTVPPLLSLIGVWVSKIKRIKFIYWVMDLQPELSIATGLIKKETILAQFFTTLGNYTIRNSDVIISLDRFMTSYLESRGAKSNSVKTIAVWPVMETVYQEHRLTNPFRIENSFSDKVVIMYSGNHAYVHKLDTLLEAALMLKNDSRFLFVFIGGGVRKKDVTAFKLNYHLENIVQLPFQPRENIHISLGSSDIQVVILGDELVGYTHPNKVYGAMYIGKPILYIGPEKSHVSDMLIELPGNINVRHGESELLVDKILGLFSKSWDEINIIGENNLNYAKNKFHPEMLKQKMIDTIIN